MRNPHYLAVHIGSTGVWERPRSAWKVYVVLAILAGLMLAVAVL